MAPEGSYWLISLPLIGDNADATWRAVVENCGGATSSSSSGHRHHHHRRSTSSTAAAAAATTTSTALADLTKFSLPELRVGTLDALLGLSDDLVRVNAAVEGVTNKLRRQLLELASSSSSGGGVGGGGDGGAAAVGSLLSGGDDPNSIAAGAATVDGASPEAYLERFSWDAAKHPPRRPLHETAAAISETAAKIEGDLRAKAGEVAALRSALAAANRKASGSLAVRDLTPLLAKCPYGRLVDTENLATLAVVVPRGAERDFLLCYETLTDFVVPRSAGTTGPVAEDGDYVLHTVVLFRRVADAYRSAARARGFQVRDADVASLVAEASSATSSKSRSSNGNGAISSSSSSATATATTAAATASAAATNSASSLRAELDAKRSALERWCHAAYGEAFSCWIHVCAVRLFAESVLRYGLPPRLLPLLVRPKGGKAAPKLRKALDGMFGSARTSKFYEADPAASSSAAGGGGGGGGGEGGEMYPYVSFTLSLDS